MSFILDALRKSEAERQREAAPTFARAPLAPARRQVPVWSWALIAALSVIIVALGVAWWQSVRLDPAAGPTVATSPPSAGAAPGGSTEVSGESVPRSGPAVVDSAPVVTQRQPSRTEQSDLSVRTLSGSAPASPSPPAAGALSAAEPQRAPEAAANAPAPPRPIGELSLVDPNQPVYRLDLLAYHTDPARAYARINGAQYAPGQRLPAGPTLTEIRRDGVVLAHRGETFLLRPR